MEAKLIQAAYREVSHAPLAASRAFACAHSLFNSWFCDARFHCWVPVRWLETWDNFRVLALRALICFELGKLGWLTSSLFLF